MIKNCFLFGHRNCPDAIFPDIVAAVRQYIEAQSVEDDIIFTVGHRGNFDRLATRAIIALKERYPHIRLNRLIAYYHPHKSVYVPEGVDDTHYPMGLEFVPKNLAIVKANEFMVAHCSDIICYVWHPASNTQKLLEQAQRRNIPIINIAAERMQ